MALQAGRLREQVTIQAESRTANGQGGFTTSWATVATVRAEVVGRSGSEAVKAGIERAVHQWQVTIRRRDDVTPQHRLQWKGRTLEIKSAMPDPRDRRDATLLVCESGV